MPPVFTRTLAEGLDRECPLAVVEAEDGMAIESGHIYLAPGGAQTGLAKKHFDAVLEVVDDPPVKNCKPSVDYLFKSAAETYGGHTIAAVLTGMGDDGTDGCGVLRAQGAFIIAQDARSSVVYGMPRHIIEAGLADTVSPLHHIPDLLQELLVSTAT